MLSCLHYFYDCVTLAHIIWYFFPGNLSYKRKSIYKQENSNNKRRDFLQLSTVTIGAVGTAAFIWPFLKSMNPAEDTIALGTTEVDVSQIEEGQSITVKWRGKPVFIRKRTKDEIDEAKTVNMSDLKDLRKMLTG